MYKYQMKLFLTLSCLTILSVNTSFKYFIASDGVSAYCKKIKIAMITFLLIRNS